MSIITLTTDFSTGSPYVAAMKGVILGIAPQATIIDLTHQITPQDIRLGAITLFDFYDAFPAGTMHVAVVDPGVGSERRIVCVETKSQLFIQGKRIQCEVVAFDSFGNALTNVTERDLPSRVDSLRIAGQSQIPALLRFIANYSVEKTGTLVALIGSGGRLEFAVVNGNAAAVTGWKTGQRLEFEISMGLDAATAAGD